MVAVIVTNSGIYQIRALHNDEVYIGSSIQLSVREKRHFRFLKNGTHDNPKLQAAYNKYGRDNFVFEVLLLCEPENCLILEQEHFDRLCPHFNIIKIAGRPPSRKGKTHTFTDSQKENIKASALLRGTAQRQKNYEKSLPLLEEIKKSGLSVRAFCCSRGLMKNRSSISAKYRKFLNET